MSMPLFIRKRMTWKSTSFAFIMFWSFFTTAIGLSTIAENIDERWLKLGLPFIASAVLQLGIGAVWSNAGKSLSERALPSVAALVMLGLILSAISGSFASSANLWIYNSAFVNEVAARKNLAVVLAPVGHVSDHATRVSEKITEYSRFANQRSELERAEGTSCDGQSLGKTCGPICRLRKHQADTAKGQAGVAQSLKKDAIKLRAQSGGVQDQAGINDLFARAAYMAEDQRLKNIRDWAEGELKGFRSGFDFEGGKRICRDRAAVEKLNGIVAILSTPIEVATVPPIVRKPTVLDVANNNIDLLQDTIFAAAAGGEALARQLAKPDVQSHLPFWAASLLIELMCAWLAFMQGRKSAKWRGTLGGLLSRRDQEKLGPRAEQRALSTLLMLRELTVWQGAERFFLTPTDGRPELANESENLAVLLKLKQPRVRRPLDVTKIAPEDAERLQAYTGARYFRIWLFPNGDRVEHKLVKSLGLDDAAINLHGASSDGATVH